MVGSGEGILTFVFTALLAGLRAEELIGADVGDIRRTDDGGGVLHVRGKGNKDRRIPVSGELLWVVEKYLESRAARFPQSRRRSQGSDALTYFSPKARYLWEQTVSGSPAAPCSTVSCVPSRRPASTANGHQAPLYTGCATRLPPN